METGWQPWNAEFKRHHYLPDAGPMAYATAYTGFVGDEAVVFVGLSGMAVGKGVREGRFCRLCTKPDWQGAGLTMQMLEWLAQRELEGGGWIGKPTTSIIHTAHPALCVTLRRSEKWRQISGKLHGGEKEGITGMGGHLRSVSGFRYYGQLGVDAARLKREEKAA